MMFLLMFAALGQAPDRVAVPAQGGRSLANQPTMTQVQEAEAHYAPHGSQRPLSSYARFYWLAPDGRLLGKYVDFGPRPAHGIHIVSEAQVPSTADGGCSVLNVEYDQSSKNLTVSCAAGR